MSFLWPAGGDSAAPPKVQLCISLWEPGSKNQRWQLAKLVHTRVKRIIWGLRPTIKNTSTFLFGPPCKLLSARLTLSIFSKNTRNKTDFSVFLSHLLAHCVLASNPVLHCSASKLYVAWKSQNFGSWYKIKRKTGRRTGSGSLRTVHTDGKSRSLKNKVKVTWERQVQS